MDSMIKKRLNKDIIIHPFCGIVDGDVTYDLPVIAKGCVIPKTIYLVNREGKEVQSKTSIILDGADLGKITANAEVEIPILGRLPIQQINLYPSLKKGKDYELVEVIL